MNISKATRVTTPPNFPPFSEREEFLPATEEYLFRTTNALASLRLLEGYLKKWHNAGSVLISEFESVYTLICHAGLADWLDWDLDGLYEELTGHPFNLDHMRKLAKANLPTETPFYYKISVTQDRLNE